MPDARRANCIRCGKHRDETGELSWKGYCTVCSQETMAEAAFSISNRTGAVHRKRLRGYAKYVQRELLDVPPPSA